MERITLLNRNKRYKLWNEPQKFINPKKKIIDVLQLELMVSYSLNINTVARNLYYITQQYYENGETFLE